MRIQSSPTVPRSVFVSLLPYERLVIRLRQHPGMLVPAAAIAVGASLATIMVSTVHSGPVAAKYVVYLLTIFLILRFLASVRRWATSHIVITNYRFLLISGKVAASPLADLTVLVTETPGLLGGLGKLGYGAFRIGPDGPSQLVIDYIPRPKEIEAVVNSLLYPDPGKWLCIHPMCQERPLLPQWGTSAHGSCTQNRLICAR